MIMSVKYRRINYLADIKQFAVERIPNEIEGYYETKWQIELFADNNHVGTFYCNTQYNEQPSTIDIATAISEYYNRFCIYFSKYGTIE